MYDHHHLGHHYHLGHHGYDYGYGCGYGYGTGYDYGTGYGFGGGRHGYTLIIVLFILLIIIGCSCWSGFSGDECCESSSSSRRSK
ncbi:sporulation protein YjcZ [Fictibacillus sp. KIGAM418]|uniref:Sporulation protein YjcZ n=1 Tax=Fictibacillus marinisediminis TaxID=2878389 RepID=A0A9X1XD30_9BACL|nr:sporulation protein YjcZ [Fictibacillus marinisediminis]